MMQNQFTRYLHTSLAVWSSVSKSHLAKLRKKTGYTFSNCKKALEVNDNDLVKAEKWLQDQAEALGWSKLSKLEGRVTAQGLVGLAFEGKKAALVEINCETDFVARNKYFKEMVNTAASACLQNLKPSQTSEIISKEWFDSERLKAVKGPDSKKLADHVALLVSNVGENVTLKRAVYIDANKDINLACYIHPDQGEKGNILNGKYGAVVAYTAPENNFTTEQIARQLCQHVIGMNPKRIKKEAEEAAAEENETKQVDGEAKNEEKEEDAMLSQDFLLDPSLTVEQLLTGAGITVHDFVRFETGEKIIVDEEPVEKVKASQLGG